MTVRNDNYRMRNEVALIMVIREQKYPEVSRETV
jgi:hypothetical protein